MDENARYELLKKVDGKLKWIIFFLICITLNTCAVADDVGDLVGLNRKAATAPAATEPAPSSTPGDA